MSAFAIFGNPVKHSKSAKIYELFAKELGMLGEYDLKLVLKEENFDSILLDFFASSGLGANVTVPFKERAFSLCHQLTQRAKMARSVNTIKKQYDGSLLGDNTDGTGFIEDLKRLHWIFKKNGNYIIQDYEENASSIKNILLIGAGGATKGIVPMLLAIPNCNINIVSRTYSRAQLLVQFHYSMGKNNIFCTPVNVFNDSNNKKYDLIINATTSSMYGDTPNISSSVIAPFTKCYDLFYQKDSTSFLRWCKNHGSEHCVDGLGMLVEQAAHSFFLWHNLFPINIVSVLSVLRSIL